MICVSALCWKTWRRPTLPCLETQNMGAGGFHGRVRDGIGCGPRQSHQVVQHSGALSVVGLGVGWSFAYVWGDVIG